VGSSVKGTQVLTLVVREKQLDATIKKSHHAYRSKKGEEPVDPKETLFDRLRPQGYRKFKKRILEEKGRLIAENHANCSPPKTRLGIRTSCRK